MGKLIKVVIALAVLLIIAFIARSILFNALDVSTDDIVKRAVNQADEIVEKSLNEANKAVEQSLKKADEAVKDTLKQAEKEVEKQLDK